MRGVYCQCEFTLKATELLCPVEDGLNCICVPSWLVLI